MVAHKWATTVTLQWNNKNTFVSLLYVKVCFDKILSAIRYWSSCKYHKCMTAVIIWTKIKHGLHCMIPCRCWGWWCKCGHPPCTHYPRWRCTQDCPWFPSRPHSAGKSLIHLRLESSQKDWLKNYEYIKLVRKMLLFERVTIKYVLISFISL